MDIMSYKFNFFTSFIHYICYLAQGIFVGQRTERHLKIEINLFNLGFAVNSKSRTVRLQGTNIKDKEDVMASLWGGGKLCGLKCVGEGDGNKHKR